MFNEKLGYDPASVESIEQYAVKLENKTFLDVVTEKGQGNSDTIEAYANKLRKGGLGNLFRRSILLDIRPILIRKRILQKQE